VLGLVFDIRLHFGVMHLDSPLLGLLLHPFNYKLQEQKSKFLYGLVICTGPTLLMEKGGFNNIFE
jgi:hypothetical protein